MRDPAHLVALYEMREEQLQLHLSLVRAGSVEARRTQSVIATMRMRKRALQEFKADVSGDARETTVH